MTWSTSKLLLLVAVICAMAAFIAAQPDFGGGPQH